MSEQKQSINPNKPLPARPWSWRKFLFRCLLFVVLFPILLILLLQIPTVQNWAVDKSISILSDKLETKVEVDRVSINIYDGLSLKNIYIEDLEGDTLLYCKSLSSSLTKSLLNVFKKEISLDAIMLRDAQINVRKKQGDTQNNVSQLLDKLKSKDPKEKKEFDFLIELNRIDLQNVSYANLDESSGMNQNYSIEHGSIEIGNLSNLPNEAGISTINLTNPKISILKFHSDLISQNVSSNLKKESSQSASNFLKIAINQINIHNGEFSFKDLRSLDTLTKKSSFEYNNLNLKELNLHLNNLYVEDINCMTGELEELSFIDHNEFKLKGLSSSKVSLSEKILAFEDFSMATNHSDMKSYLAFKFNSLSDFKQMPTKVKFDLRLKESQLSLADVAYFVPGLAKNNFFIKNRGKNFKITGNISNAIDRLAGKNMKIVIDERTYFYGNFSTRNLTNSKEALLNIKVNELSTDMHSLEKIIPNFKAPQNYYKLGDLMFNGRFDGYLRDFVAYGSLSTDLGSALMDINLDIKNGSEAATYSGELELMDFDLGKWGDNKDLGIVNFESYIDNGKGLTLASAFADMDANISEFNYKGYTYRDFIMNGKLDQTQFSGRFTSEDPNADLHFDGEIIYHQGTPTFDFEADVKNIDFQKLNLTDHKSILSGKLKLKSSGNEFSNANGIALIEDLKFIDRDSTYLMQNVLINSTIDDQNRIIDIESDLGTIHLDGEMDIAGIGHSVKALLKRNYPEHFKNLHVDLSKIEKKQKINYQLNISDSKNLLALAKIPGYRIKNLALTGSIDNQENELQLEGDIEELIIKDDVIYNTSISAINLERQGKLAVSLDSMLLKNRIYSPIALKTTTKGDLIEFNIKSNEVFDSLQSFDLSGNLQTMKKGYALTLDDSDLEMFGTSWSFQEGNTVTMDHNFIELEGFVLSDGHRSISIDDIDNKGIEANLNDFNFLTVNGIIDYENIEFAGEGNVSVSIDNIFKIKTIKTKLEVPEFTLNGIDYGSLLVQGGKEPEDPYAVTIKIGDERFNIDADAQINPDTKEIVGRLDAKKVPFELFEMIITTGISGTDGDMIASMDISGTLDDIKVNGDFMVNNAKVRVDYIGETYYTSNQVIKITENYIDFSDRIFTDSEGNAAIIQGGMKHDFFQNYRMDLRLTSPKIILLNTTEKDNPIYYGLGRGFADVSFKGPFAKADMVINAVTGPGTHLSIPVKYYETGYEESFIKFVNLDDIYQREKELDLEEYKVEGLDVEMNITITPDALMKIIFNEKLNDVIKGRGNGDVQVFFTRAGDFLTYGNFDIEQGEYLFTALEIVAKSFEVVPGSTIQWTGDPINAQLDIKAEYADLRSSLRTFLDEYFTEATANEVESESKRRTDVDLLLNLGGTLYKPDIKFDLEFPNIESSQLRSLVNAKMTALRANPILLNDQVAGLIMFNTFLPSSNSARNQIYTGNAALGTANATISEFVSNQFSHIISALANGLVEESALISSIDVELGLSQNDNFSGNSRVLDLFDPDEIGANLNTRFKFLDEKVSLKLGGNYVRKPLLNSSTPFLVGDLAIEYDITQDRRLKLRFYNRFDRDDASQQPKNKSGVGISYRKEFGRMVDFEQNLFEPVKIDSTTQSQ